MNSSQPSVPLRRSTDRIIGGVCAGLAKRLGVDPALVRLAAVVVGLLSGGAALVAYLVAWVLIPPAGIRPTAVPHPVPEPLGDLPRAQVDTRTAWNAIGDELRMLIGAVRTPPPATEPVPDRPRSPLHSADRMATAAGDRLRTAEVRDSARRLASGLSTAIAGSVDDLRRAGRTRD